MDTAAFKDAQKRFLARYPGGFAHPEFASMDKKYKMAQHEKFARDSFGKKSFDDPKTLVSNLATLISRSAMISMFEKPKFKSASSALAPKQRQAWADAIYNLLHGKAKAGFEAWVDLLDEHKLAKWTLATVVGAYYRPQKEAFIKPSTTKLVIDKLGLELAYHSKPNWEFYRDFRKATLAMRDKAPKIAAPNLSAFSGFLMMTLGGKL